MAWRSHVAVPVSHILTGRGESEGCSDFSAPLGASSAPNLRCVIGPRTSCFLDARSPALSHNATICNSPMSFSLGWLAQRLKHSNGIFLLALMYAAPAFRLARPRLCAKIRQSQKCLETKRQMSALYVVLEKKTSNADVYVNGIHLERK